MTVVKGINQIYSNHAGSGLARIPVVPLPLAVLAVVLLTSISYALLVVVGHESKLFWLSGVLLTVAVAYSVVRLFGELIALRALEAGIHKVREGLLEPIAPVFENWTSGGRLINEFNQTVNTLSLMFQTVEQCQGRFLNERNRFITILQNLPAALLSVDDDLTITVANLLADRMFAVPSGSLTGKNIFEIMDLNEHDRELLRDAFLYKRSVGNQEIMLRMNGKTSFHSLNLGFYNSDENDLKSVLILQDITEYKSLMESLSTREKLVAMGQLAAGVAHELNTPLGNILGYAQLLQKNLNADALLGGHAKVIVEETQRCSSVINELLNFARKDTCSGETCDLNALVQELTETFLNCRLKRYRIDIVLDLSPDRLILEGGCGQLDIVLTNLLINAIDALEGVESPKIVVNTWAEDGYGLISVSDNGPGVPEAIQARLFDLFYSTKEVGKGTGLGLSISQAIVAKRGGYIKYDPQYRQGARFIVKLPSVNLERVAA